MEGNVLIWLWLSVFAVEAIRYLQAISPAGPKRLLTSNVIPAAILSYVTFFKRPTANLPGQISKVDSHPRLSNHAFFLLLLLLLLLFQGHNTLVVDVRSVWE